MAKKIRDADGKEYVVKEKKPFYKRWWFIALAVIFVFGAFLGGDDDNEAEAEEPETEEVEVVEAEEEPEEIEDEVVLPNEIDDLAVTDVRGDDSGKWKKVVSGFGINMPDNALAYYEAYMEGDEIHFLISFANDTTTSIKDYGTGLYVDITQYTEKEEHNANKIGSGMMLKQFTVDKETGDIEELDF